MGAKYQTLYEVILYSKYLLALVIVDSQTIKAGSNWAY